MKADDVRAMTPDQLSDELMKLKKEQFNLRFQRATGQLENTGRVRIVRRDIARIKTIAAQIRSLKRFPDRQIVVGAITGPTTPYTVRWVDRPGDNVGPRPHIAASCTSADTSSAAPAVRIQQWAEAFGANGMVLPVCVDNFGSALDKIAELMIGALPVITVIPTRSASSPGSTSSIPSSTSRISMPSSGGTSAARVVRVSGA